MATLPESVSIKSNIQTMPGKTWLIEGDRIVGEVDGIEAVRQAVDIILSTERYRWPIYKPYSGAEIMELIGQDAGYCGVEIQRRITDALLMDDRIKSVNDYTYRVYDGVVYAEFTVKTVYGELKEKREVTIA